MKEICCSNHYNVKRYQKVENLFKYQDFSDLIEKRDGHYIYQYLCWCEIQKQINGLVNVFYVICTIKFVDEMLIYLKTFFCSEKNPKKPS